MNHEPMNHRTYPPRWSLPVMAVAGLLGMSSLGPAQAIDGKTPEERIQAFSEFCTSVEPPNTKECRVAMVYIAARIRSPRASSMTAP